MRGEEANRFRDNTPRQRPSDVVKGHKDLQYIESYKDVQEIEADCFRCWVVGRWGAGVCRVGSERALF